MIHFLRSTQYAMGKLCKQSILLAGLALLCLLAPFLLGSAVESQFSSGVAFEGITLALTSGEEESHLDTLQGLLSAMEDLGRYVTFQAMDHTQAMEALEQGEVTAVLHVPMEFIQGILQGDNPDITVYVNEDQPLEGLLLYWLGQSAADMLSAVQAGIYAVQDSYAANPPEGLSHWDMTTGINLVYIGWTLDRQSIFRTETLQAADSLPVATHYQLCLLAWLGLTMAPVFCPLFEPRRLAARRRLRALGRGMAASYFSDFAACCCLLFLLVLLPLVFLDGGTVWGGLLAALAYALLCGGFGCLCCLAAGDSARCGGLSFLLSLAALALAGGIVPPVMLPQTLRQLQWLSPVTWLREIASISLGYGCSPSSLLLPALSLAAMTGLSLLLYRRRMNAGEVEA